ncbi:uncharacterized protein LOC115883699 [Sitophilus oryzae]|uniref:Uncharacterized protein LOC115883699 n=1 Tax=Sitophilus oryzae TaxID=7048 RepID=A0A6J2Y2L8_SITOR|nr:uncharacterized protein LOC115883699 [Sitophilus oryzae]
MDVKLTKDAPIGSIFVAHPSGWITVQGFLKWLNAFVDRVNPTEENPILLILDGHSTHKDLQVILYAKEHHVHMLSLPPHTTHKLQPLDRAIMKPFKGAFNAACEVWMSKYGRLGLKITVQEISGLVGSAFSKICRMELAQSAFQCTGIYPLNKNIFTELDFLPASNTTKILEADNQENHEPKNHSLTPSTGLNFGSLNQSSFDKIVPSVSTINQRNF